MFMLLLQWDILMPHWSSNAVSVRNDNVTCNKRWIRYLWRYLVKLICTVCGLWQLYGGNLLSLGEHSNGQTTTFHDNSSRHVFIYDGFSMQLSALNTVHERQYQTRTIQTGMCWFKIYRRPFWNPLPAWNLRIRDCSCTCTMLTRT